VKNLKAHISKEETDKALEKAIKEQLDKARFIGLAIGAKSISKVVMDKATDESKTAEEKIADIIEFCKVGLGINEETVESEETTKNE
jgi:hypothetical protein